VLFGHMNDKWLPILNMIIFESGMKRIPKVSGMQPSIITQMDNHMSGLEWFIIGKFTMMQNWPKL